MLPTMVSLWGVVSASQGERLLLSPRYRILAYRNSLKDWSITILGCWHVDSSWVCLKVWIFQIITTSIYQWARWYLARDCSLSLFFLSSAEVANTVCIGQHCGTSSDALRRVAIFFASTSLSGAFSGLLAAAIDLMNGKGGKPGWAWIFILVCFVTDYFVK